MTVEFLFYFAAIIAVPLIGRAIYDARQKTRRRARMFLAAEQSGGRFIEHGGWLWGDKSRVKATIEERKVVLSTQRKSAGNSTYQVTQVAAPVAVDWSFEMKPSIIPGLHNTLIGERLRTGHRAFDTAYSLNSRYPDLTRRVFGARSEARYIPMRFKRLHVSLGGGELVIERYEGGNLADEDDLELMRYANLLARIIEETRPLLGVDEAVGGGLSLSVEPGAAGALSPVDAPAGAISPAQD